MYCQFCGHRLDDAVICEGCGAQKVGGEWRNTATHGADTSQTATSATSPTSPTSDAILRSDRRQRSPGPDSKAIRTVGIAVVGIALVVGAVFWWTRTSDGSKSASPTAASAHSTPQPGGISADWKTTAGSAISGSAKDSQVTLALISRGAQPDAAAPECQVLLSDLVELQGTLPSGSSQMDGLIRKYVQALQPSMKICSRWVDGSPMGGAEDAAQALRASASVMTAIKAQA